MANIIISKLKVRRGTNTQRKAVVLDQGELGYTIDTKRLFIGNGATYGGEVIGSKIHPPISNTSSLTGVIAEIGDLVNVNGIFYQLTLTDYTDINSWSNVNLKINSDFFEYNITNELTPKDNSITLEKLTSEALTTLATNTNVDDETIEIHIGNLRVKESGIDTLQIAPSAINEYKISTSIAGNGLSGGNGVSLFLNVNPSEFEFVGRQLNLKDVTYINGISGGNGSPLGIYANPDVFTFNLNKLDLNSNSVGRNSIRSDSFSNGISGGSGSSISLNVDPYYFKFNSNKLQLSSNSIGKDLIRSDSFFNGISGGSGSSISLNVDSHFNFSSNKLTINDNSINYQKMKPEAFTNGIVGGNANQIQIDSNLSQFTFIDNKLTIKNGGVGVNELSSATFTDGIIGGNGSKVKLDYDTSNFTISSNKLQLTNTIVPTVDNLAFPSINYDIYGRLTSATCTMQGLLTGNSTLSGFNVNNSLSAIFNGSINSTNDGTSNNIMKFTAIDSTNTICTLSSAGFITFVPNLSTADGDKLKRFAIPVFAY